TGATAFQRLLQARDDVPAAVEIAQRMVVRRTVEDLAFVVGPDVVARGHAGGGDLDGVLAGSARRGGWSGGPQGAVGSRCRGGRPPSRLLPAGPHHAGRPVEAERPPLSAPAGSLPEHALHVLVLLPQQLVHPLLETGAGRTVFVVAA